MPKFFLILLPLFLTPNVLVAQVLPISLPPGVTIAAATPQQVADATAAAIKANPSGAQVVGVAVATAIAGLPNAEALASALATAIAANVPPTDLASIIAAMAKAAFDAGAPELAVTLASVAAGIVPGQSQAIADLVSGAVPAKADAVRRAVASAVSKTVRVNIPSTSQFTSLNPANLNAVDPAPSPTPGRQTNSPAN